MFRIWPDCHECGISRSRVARPAWAHQIPHPPIVGRFPQLGKEKHMRRRIESKRGFGRTLIAATVGAIALGATVVPALADTVVYGYPPPATVYTPAPAYTYTYTQPVYPPAY